MLEWLLKFTTSEFAEGTIGFEVGRAAVLFGVIAVVLVGGFFVVYALASVYSSDRVKRVSLAVRVPALLLLCLALFEPVLVIPDVVPDENFVAVLVDASESMTIPDGTFETTRLEDVNHILFDESDGIAGDLETHFQVRYYAFGDEVMRVDSAEHVRAQSDGTDLSAALDRMLTDFRGIPLAGVVIVTDGNDNSAGIPLNKAEELRSLDIPLHVVGVGREAFQRERELLDVSVTKAVEEQTGAEIDVKVRSWGEERAPVDFNLYQGEELVFSERSRLKGDGKIDQISFFFEPRQSGPLEYRLEVAASEDELNLSNNALELLIDSRSDTMRVLYFEGALRQDFKFVKRALEDDQVVDFVSVSRTGTGKYYRQGIRHPGELAGGFPATEAELFGFKALVFGDIEASAFSPEQLAMIEKFVRVRGGGFLMLGGRNSFADGGYWNTAIERLLPVKLDPGRRTALPPRFIVDGKPPIEQGFKFVPTAAGVENPILKLSPDAASNRLRWASMPGLTSLNFLGGLKPGAVRLAEKPKDDFGEAEPLLVTQSYGKGRSTALATASTWRWQMLLEADDLRHERFWRQLVRWQVASAPDHVNVGIASDRPEPDRETAISVDLYDARYRPLEQAEVRATVRDPFGATSEVSFLEELAVPGTYTAPFIPSEEGVYRVDVRASHNGSEIGFAEHTFLVRSSRKEFHDATLKRSFLESIAEANGGVYYEPHRAPAIAPALRNRRTSSSVYRSEYLWDMPLLFGIVLILLTGEWWYRRRKGLP